MLPTAAMCALAACYNACWAASPRHALLLPAALPAALTCHSHVAALRAVAMQLLAAARSITAAAIQSLVQLLRCPLLCSSAAAVRALARLCAARLAFFGIHCSEQSLLGCRLMWK